MQCPNCRADFTAGSKYCGECGTALLRACPSCDHINPPKAKFCSECGTSLGTAIAQGSNATSEAENPAFTSSEERRQITVFFCDLVGSTALSTQLDPELTRDVVGSYLSCCSTEIKRLDGTVVTYLGDGVLAYFGYPTARENDAERAVRAGLAVIQAVQELQPAPDVTLQTRVGIASGIVVVGDLIRDGMLQENAVIGETANLAARLQGTAGPDQLVISTTTHRLAHGQFVTKPIGPLSLNGFQDPVTAYRVLGLRDTPSQWELRTEDTLTPMVGRDAELTLLNDRWKKAKEKSGQVVFVSAEPGVGKSRLVKEFRQQLHAEQITTLSLYCSPYHTGTALYPVIDALRRYITAELELDEVLEAGVLKQWLQANSGGETFDLLLPLLLPQSTERSPIELPSDERRRLTMNALVAVVDTLANERPTLLVCEDLHWLDPTTNELLGMLVGLAREHRLMLLLTARPEYAPQWRGERHLSELRLNHLSREECRILVAQLAQKVLSRATVDRVIERTDGVPLYVEELARIVIEADDPNRIPETLRDALAARLDRLGPAKEVAQAAAVLGRDFSWSSLKTVSSQSDEQLTSNLTVMLESGLIHRVHGRASHEYEFKHALVRDAAYDSLLRGPRQTLHLRAADAVHHSPDPQPEVIAHHLEHGGEVEIAAEWYSKAASSAGLDSPEEALRHWEKVHFILAPIQQSEASTQLFLQAAMQILKFAWRQGLSDDRVETVFKQAKASAVKRGDVQAQLGLLYGIGCHHMLGANPKLSIPFFEESIALADPTGDPELSWVAREPFEWALLLIGDLIRALEMNEEQIGFSEIDPSIGIDTVIGFSTAFSFGHRGWMLTEVGRFDEASAAFHRCEEIACLQNETDPRIMNDALHCGLLVRTGEYQAALKMGRRAIEAADHSGNQFSLVLGHLYYGNALASLAQWQDALASLKLALQIVRDSGAALFREPDILAALAEVYSGLDDSLRAQALAEEAIQVALRRQIPIAEIIGQLALARALLSDEPTDNQTQVEAALNRALQLVGSTNAKSYEPQICIERSRLAAMRGDSHSATQELLDAHRIFTQLGAVGYVQKLSALLKLL